LAAKNGEGGLLFDALPGPNIPTRRSVSATLVRWRKFIPVLTRLSQIAVAHKANQRGQALREITLFILALSTDASVQQRMIRLDYM
jgi:hypothetical protein